MKNTAPLFLALSLAIPSLVLSGNSHAADMPRPGFAMMHGNDMHDQDDRHRQGGMWRETLSTEQRAKIGKMHLALKKESSLIDARIDLAKAELNQLITTDKPDMAAVNKKIDEITALKAQIMKKRYAHIAEMRTTLTSEQLVSFDTMILSGKHDKNKGHQ